MSTALQVSKLPAAWQPPLQSSSLSPSVSLNHSAPPHLPCDELSHTLRCLIILDVASYKSKFVCLLVCPWWSLSDGLYQRLYVRLCACACMLSCFSCTWLFAISKTVTCQTPLSMGFSRQEYWSGLPFPSPRDLPDLGIEPVSPMAPTLARGFFYHWATWKAPYQRARAGKSEILSFPWLTGKHFTGSQIRKEKERAPICSVCLFVWWKYSQLGQFQATDMTSLNAELGRDPRNQLLVDSYQWAQAHLGHLLTRLPQAATYFLLIKFSRFCFPLE